VLAKLLVWRLIHDTNQGKRKLRFNNRENKPAYNIGKDN